MMWSSPTLLLLMATACGAAQPCAEYDASAGTPPDAQGWTPGPDNMGAAEIDGDVLRVSSLPLSNGACPFPSEARFEYFILESPKLGLDDEPVLTARLRVVTSQYGTNACNREARPGFALWIAADDRVYWVGLGETKIFLANIFSTTFSDPNLVEADFDTTDGFHTYTLATTPSMAE